MAKGHNLGEIKVTINGKVLGEAIRAIDELTQPLQLLKDELVSLALDIKDKLEALEKESKLKIEYRGGVFADAPGNQLESGDMVYPPEQHEGD